MPEKTEKMKPPGTEWIDRTMDQYEQALKAGVKFQEDAGKWWTNFVNQVSSPQEWQKKVSRVASDLIPAAEKRMSECLDLVQQNNRAGMNLMKKAIEASQSLGTASENINWMDLRDASLGAVRSSTEAFSQINNKVLDWWMECARKNTEAFVPSAAQS
jgi:hypothetical protein